jgi:hypothetical protein
MNVPKANLEGSFVKLLRRLEPESSYLKLFREIVLDAWNSRREDARRLQDNQERRVAEIDRRKDSLLSAYVYEKVLDKTTYEAERDKLEEQLTLAQLELHEATLDEFDVEGVIAFSENLLANAATLWLQFDLSQKQRFQRVVFPEGLEFDGKGFATAVTSPVFSYLQELEGEKVRMVARIVPSWNQSQVWLQELAELRET